MHRITILLSALLTAAVAEAAMPHYREVPTSEAPAVDRGAVRRYIVQSEFLGDDMTVDIWTPEGYSESGTARYPVLYAHDGQNILDPAMSFAGVDWDLDNTAQRLTDEGRIDAPIVVAMHNRGDKGLRPSDYFPEKVIDYISEADRDKTKIFQTCKDGFFGDEEAAFVAAELKPLIDSLYRTDERASHTFTIGSSMGGLASLYLLCEYPDVFGGAACMSTHWVGSFEIDGSYNLSDDPVCARAILAFMEACLPSSAGHILYLDQGTAGWDALYSKYEPDARRIAAEKGYSESDGTLMCHDAAGAGHNEWFWQQRAALPLEFLFAKRRFATVTSPVTCFPADNTYISVSGTVHHISDPTLLAPGIYIHRGRKLIRP